MAFFDPAPPRPQPTPPVWLAPPMNVVGTMAPLHRIVARTSSVVIALTRLLAYPSGCQFTLALAARLSGVEPTVQRRLRASFGIATYDPLHRPDQGEPVRCGVQFADGRRATSVDSPPLWDPASPTSPTGPVFVEHNSYGTTVRDDELWESPGFWLWPPPPPEPFTFAVEWPAADVPLTTTELDGAAIVAAGEAAEEFWPDTTGDDYAK